MIMKFDIENFFGENNLDLRDSKWSLS